MGMFIYIAVAYFIAMSTILYMCGTWATGYRVHIPGNKTLQRDDTACLVQHTGHYMSGYSLDRIYL